MLYNKIFSLIEKINPEEITFWTGSGISKQFPTDLPTGNLLLELCMNSFMPQGTFNLLRNFFSKGKFKDSYGNIKTFPRLELVIEDIVGVLGYKTFNYFSFMKIPHQYLNLYHLFFANHINRGGTHFTMNFDNGIETSLRNTKNKILNGSTDAKCFQSKLVKLHGTITEKQLYENLGITLKNVTKGFSENNANNILNALTKSKILCFIGYGGVDSFDVTPFFHSYVGNAQEDRLKNLNVIWIHHKINKDFEPCKTIDIPHGASTILKALEKAGSKIHPYKGEATRLISRLKDQWGWNYQVTQKKTAYNWREIFEEEMKRSPVLEDYKNLIAGQYMAALGAGKQAVNFCISSENFSSGFITTNPRLGIFTSLTNQWWRVYTNGLRDWGKYGKAVKKVKEWKRQATSHYDEFFALSRLMGEYRMRGNYIQAFLTSRKAFNSMTKHRLENSTNPDELQAMGDFLITYLHLHRDLWKKHKIIRKLLFKPWRNIICQSWVKAFFINKKRPFPRYATQLYDLAERIFGETAHFMKQTRLKDPSLPEKIEDCLINTDISNFLETDSLLGDINYQREFVIDKKGKDRSMLNEIRDNLLKAEAIEDQPGIWKAYYRFSKEYLAQKNYKMAIKNTREALRQIKEVEYSIIRNITYKIRLWKIMKRSIIFYLLDK
ncbi:MAG: SIR2 family protein [Candidatus Helarchaeota archaeon]